MADLPLNCVKGLCIQHASQHLSQSLQTHTQIPYPSMLMHAHNIKPQPHTHTPPHRHAPTHAHTHTNTYTCMHTRTHTHTHTATYLQCIHGDSQSTVGTAGKPLGTLAGMLFSTTSRELGTTSQVTHHTHIGTLPRMELWKIKKPNTSASTSVSPVEQWC